MKLLLPLSFGPVSSFQLSSDLPELQKANKYACAIHCNVTSVMVQGMTSLDTRNIYHVFFILGSLSCSILGLYRSISCAFAMVVVNALTAASNRKLCKSSALGPLAIAVLFQVLYSTFRERRITWRP